MPFFTKENASEYARLGNIARWQTPKSLPQPDQTTASSDATRLPITDEFTAKRLIRVRKQLERLDDMLEAEQDTKRIKELSDATTRLAEQERQLSGRPLPGTLRPDKPKSKPAQLPPAPDTQ